MFYLLSNNLNSIPIIFEDKTFSLPNILYITSLNSSYVCPLAEESMISLSSHKVSIFSYIYLLITLAFNANALFSTLNLIISPNLIRLDLSFNNLISIVLIPFIISL